MHHTAGLSKLIKFASLTVLLSLLVGLALYFCLDGGCGVENFSQDLSKIISKIEKDIRAVINSKHFQRKEKVSPASKCSSNEIFNEELGRCLPAANEVDEKIYYQNKKVKTIEPEDNFYYHKNGEILKDNKNLFQDKINDLGSLDSHNFIGSSNIRDSSKIYESVEEKSLAHSDTLIVKDLISELKEKLSKNGNIWEVLNLFEKDTSKIKNQYEMIQNHGNTKGIEVKASSGSFSFQNFEKHRILKRNVGKKKLKKDDKRSIYPISSDEEIADEDDFEDKKGFQNPMKAIQEQMAIIEKEKAKLKDKSNFENVLQDSENAKPKPNDLKKKKKKLTKRSPGKFHRNFLNEIYEVEAKFYKSRIGNFEQESKQFKLRKKIPSKRKIVKKILKSRKNSNFYEVIGRTNMGGNEIQSDFYQKKKTTYSKGADFEKEPIRIEFEETNEIHQIRPRKLRKIRKIPSKSHSRVKRSVEKSTPPKTDILVNLDNGGFRQVNVTFGKNQNIKITSTTNGNSSGFDDPNGAEYYDYGEYEDDGDYEVVYEYDDDEVPTKLATLKEEKPPDFDDGDGDIYDEVYELEEVTDFNGTAHNGTIVKHKNNSDFDLKMILKSDGSGGESGTNRNKNKKKKSVSRSVNDLNNDEVSTSTEATTTTTTTTNSAPSDTSSDTTTSADGLTEAEELAMDPELEIARALLAEEAKFGSRAVRRRSELLPDIDVESTTTIPEKVTQVPQNLQSIYNEIVTQKPAEIIKTPEPQIVKNEITTTSTSKPVEQNSNSDNMKIDEFQNRLQDKPQSYENDDDDEDVSPRKSKKSKSDRKLKGFAFDADKFESSYGDSTTVASKLKGFAYLEQKKSNEQKKLDDAEEAKKLEFEAKRQKMQNPGSGGEALIKFKTNNDEDTVVKESNSKNSRTIANNEKALNFQDKLHDLPISNPIIDSSKSKENHNKILAKQRKRVNLQEIDMKPEQLNASEPIDTTRNVNNAAVEKHIMFRKNESGSIFVHDDKEIDVEKELDDVQVNESAVDTLNKLMGEDITDIDNEFDDNDDPIPPSEKKNKPKVDKKNEEKKTSKPKGKKDKKSARNTNKAVAADKKPEAGKPTAAPTGYIPDTPAPIKLPKLVPLDPKEAELPKGSVVVDLKKEDKDAKIFEDKLAKQLAEYEKKHPSKSRRVNKAAAAGGKPTAAPTGYIPDTPAPIKLPKLVPLDPKEAELPKGSVVVDLKKEDKDAKIFEDKLAKQLAEYEKKHPSKSRSLNKAAAGGKPTTAPTGYIPDTPAPIKLPKLVPLDPKEAELPKGSVVIDLKKEDKDSKSFEDKLVKQLAEYDKKHPSKSRSLNKAAAAGGKPTAAPTGYIPDTPAPIKLPRLVPLDPNEAELPKGSVVVDLKKEDKDSKSFEDKLVKQLAEYDKKHPSKSRSLNKAAAAGGKPTAAPTGYIPDTPAPIKLPKLVPLDPNEAELPKGSVVVDLKKEDKDSKSFEDKLVKQLAEYDKKHPSKSRRVNKAAAAGGKPTAAPTGYIPDTPAPIKLPKLVPLDPNEAELPKGSVVIDLKKEDKDAKSFEEKLVKQLAEYEKKHPTPKKRRTVSRSILNSRKNELLYDDPDFKKVLDNVEEESDDIFESKGEQLQRKKLRKKVNKISAVRSTLAPKFYQPEKTTLAPVIITTEAPKLPETTIPTTTTTTIPTTTTTTTIPTTTTTETTTTTTTTTTPEPDTTITLIDLNNQDKIPQLADEILEKNSIDYDKKHFSKGQKRGIGIKIGNKSTPTKKPDMVTKPPIIATTTTTTTKKPDGKKTVQNKKKSILTAELLPKPPKEDLTLLSADKGEPLDEPIDSYREVIEKVEIDKDEENFEKNVGRQLDELEKKKVVAKNMNKAAAPAKPAAKPTEAPKKAEALPQGYIPDTPAPIKLPKLVPLDPNEAELPKGSVVIDLKKEDKDAQSFEEKLVKQIAEYEKKHPSKSRRVNKAAAAGGKPTAAPTGYIPDTPAPIKLPKLVPLDPNEAELPKGSVVVDLKKEDKDAQTFEAKLAKQLVEYEKKHPSKSRRVNKAAAGGKPTAAPTGYIPDTPAPIKLPRLVPLDPNEAELPKGSVVVDLKKEDKDSKSFEDKLVKQLAEYDKKHPSKSRRVNKAAAGGKPTAAPTGYIPDTPAPIKLPRLVPLDPNEAELPKGTVVIDLKKEDMDNKKFEEKLAKQLAEYEKKNPGKKSRAFLKRGGLGGSNKGKFNRAINGDGGEIYDFPHTGYETMDKSNINSNDDLNYYLNDRDRDHDDDIDGLHGTMRLMGLDDDEIFVSPTRETTTEAPKPKKSKFPKRKIVKKRKTTTTTKPKYSGIYDIFDDESLIPKDFDNPYPTTTTEATSRRPKLKRKFPKSSKRAMILNKKPQNDIFGNDFDEKKPKEKNEVVNLNLEKIHDENSPKDTSHDLDHLFDEKIVDKISFNENDKSISTRRTTTTTTTTPPTTVSTTIKPKKKRKGKKKTTTAPTTTTTTTTTTMPTTTRTTTTTTTTTENYESTTEEPDEHITEMPDDAFPLSEGIKIVDEKPDFVENHKGIKNNFDDEKIAEVKIVKKPSRLEQLLLEQQKREDRKSPVKPQDDDDDEDTKQKPYFVEGSQKVATQTRSYSSSTKSIKNSKQPEENVEYSSIETDSSKHEDHISLDHELDRRELEHEISNDSGEHSLDIDDSFFGKKSVHINDELRMADTGARERVNAGIQFGSNDADAIREESKTEVKDDLDSMFNDMKTSIDTTDEDKEYAKPYLEAEASNIKRGKSLSTKKINKELNGTRHNTKSFIDSELHDAKMMKNENEATGEFSHLMSQLNEIDRQKMKKNKGKAYNKDDGEGGSEILVLTNPNRVQQPDDSHQEIEEVSENPAQSKQMMAEIQKESNGIENEPATVHKDEDDDFPNLMSQLNSMKQSKQSNSKGVAILALSSNKGKKDEPIKFTKVEGGNADPKDHTRVMKIMDMLDKDDKDLKGPQSSHMVLTQTRKVSVSGDNNNNNNDKKRRKKRSPDPLKAYTHEEFENKIVSKQMKRINVEKEKLPEGQEALIDARKIEKEAKKRHKLFRKNETGSIFVQDDVQIDMEAFDDFYVNDSALYTMNQMMGEDMTDLEGEGPKLSTPLTLDQEFGFGSGKKKGGKKGSNGVPIMDLQEDDDGKMMNLNEQASAIMKDSNNFGRKAGGGKNKNRSPSNELNPGQNSPINDQLSKDLNPLQIDPAVAKLLKKTNAENPVKLPVQDQAAGGGEGQNKEGKFNGVKGQKKGAGGKLKRRKKGRKVKMQNRGLYSEGEVVTINSNDEIPSNGTNTSQDLGGPPTDTYLPNNNAKGTMTGHVDVAVQPTIHNHTVQVRKEKKDEVDREMLENNTALPLKKDLRNQSREVVGEIRGVHLETLNNNSGIPKSNNVTEVHDEGVRNANTTHKDVTNATVIHNQTVIIRQKTKEEIDREMAINNTAIELKKDLRNQSREIVGEIRDVHLSTLNNNSGIVKSNNVTEVHDEGVRNANTTHKDVTNATVIHNQTVIIRQKTKEEVDREMAINNTAIELKKDLKTQSKELSSNIKNVHLDTLNNNSGIVQSNNVTEVHDEGVRNANTTHKDVQNSQIIHGDTSQVRINGKNEVITDVMKDNEGLVLKNDLKKQSSGVRTELQVVHAETLNNNSGIVKSNNVNKVHDEGVANANTTHEDVNDYDYVSEDGSKIRDDGKIEVSKDIAKDNEAIDLKKGSQMQARSLFSDMKGLQGETLNNKSGITTSNNVAQVHDEGVQKASTKSKNIVTGDKIAKETGEARGQENDEIVKEMKKDNEATEIKEENKQNVKGTRTAFEALNKETTNNNTKNIPKTLSANEALAEGVAKASTKSKNIQTSDQIGRETSSDRTSVKSEVSKDISTDNEAQTLNNNNEGSKNFQGLKDRLKTINSGALDKNGKAYNAENELRDGTKKAQDKLNDQMAKSSTNIKADMNSQSQDNRKDLNEELSNGNEAMNLARESKSDTNSEMKNLMTNLKASTGDPGAGGIGKNGRGAFSPSKMRDAVSIKDLELTNKKKYDSASSIKKESDRHTKSFKNDIKQDTQGLADDNEASDQFKILFKQLEGMDQKQKKTKSNDMMSIQAPNLDNYKSAAMKNFQKSNTGNMAKDIKKSSMASGPGDNDAAAQMGNLYSQFGQIKNKKANEIVPSDDDSSGKKKKNSPPSGGKSKKSQPPPKVVPQEDDLGSVMSLLDEKHGSDDFSDDFSSAGMGFESFLKKRRKRAAPSGDKKKKNGGKPSGNKPVKDDVFADIEQNDQNELLFDAGDIQSEAWQTHKNFRKGERGSIFEVDDDDLFERSGKYDDMDIDMSAISTIHQMMGGSKGSKSKTKGFGAKSFAGFTNPAEELADGLASLDTDTEMDPFEPTADGLQPRLPPIIATKKGDKYIKSSYDKHDTKGRDSPSLMENEGLVEEESIKNLMSKGKKKPAAKNPKNPKMKDFVKSHAKMNKEMDEIKETANQMQSVLKQAKEKTRGMLPAAKKDDQTSPGTTAESSASPGSSIASSSTGSTESVAASGSDASKSGKNQPKSGSKKTNENQKGSRIVGPSKPDDDDDKTTKKPKKKDEKRTLAVGTDYKTAKQLAQWKKDKNEEDSKSYGDSDTSVSSSSASSSDDDNDVPWTKTIKPDPSSTAHLKPKIDTENMKNNAAVPLKKGLKTQSDGLTNEVRGTNEKTLNKNSGITPNNNPGEVHDDGVKTAHSNHKDIKNAPKIDKEVVKDRTEHQDKIVKDVNTNNQANGLKKDLGDQSRDVVPEIDRVHGDTTNKNSGIPKGDTKEVMAQGLKGAGVTSNKITKQTQKIDAETRENERVESGQTNYEVNKDNEARDLSKANADESRKSVGKYDELNKQTQSNDKNIPKSSNAKEVMDQGIKSTGGTSDKITKNTQRIDSETRNSERSEKQKTQAEVNRDNEARDLSRDNADESRKSVGKYDELNKQTQSNDKNIPKSSNAKEVMDQGIKTSSGTSDKISKKSQKIDSDAKNAERAEKKRTQDEIDMDNEAKDLSRDNSDQSRKSVGKYDELNKQTQSNDKNIPKSSNPKEVMDQGIKTSGGTSDKISKKSQKIDSDVKNAERAEKKRTQDEIDMDNEAHEFGQVIGENKAGLRGDIDDLTKQTMEKDNKNIPKSNDVSRVLEDGAKKASTNSKNVMKADAIDKNVANVRENAQNAIHSNVKKDNEAMKLKKDADSKHSNNEMMKKLKNMNIGTLDDNGVPYDADELINIGTMNAMKKSNFDNKKILEEASDAGDETKDGIMKDLSFGNEALSLKDDHQLESKDEIGKMMSELEESEGAGGFSFTPYKNGNLDFFGAKSRYKGEGSGGASALAIVSSTTTTTTTTMAPSSSSMSSTTASPTTSTNSETTTTSSVTTTTSPTITSTTATTTTTSPIIQLNSQTQSQTQTQTQASTQTYPKREPLENEKDTFDMMLQKFDAYEKQNKETTKKISSAKIPSKGGSQKPPASDSKFYPKPFQMGRIFDAIFKRRKRDLRLKRNSMKLDQSLDPYLRIGIKKGLLNEKELALPLKHRQMKKKLFNSMLQNGKGKDYEKRKAYFKKV